VTTAGAGPGANPFELWFTERQPGDIALSLRVTRTLMRETTPYQELMVVETPGFGRLLSLDGTIQLTERDEFFYHEMLAHVPLAAHPAPRRVLVIGGGDGGTVREVLRHEGIEHVDLVEIDEAVVRAGRAYFPGVSSGLDDPRVAVHYEDGIAFVARAEAQSYDVVLVDSTDPVGPAVGLFRSPFYASIARALGPDGIVVAQSESPLLNAELITSLAGEMRTAFRHVNLYLCPVPTYPSGQWSFMAGCQTRPPVEPRPDLRLDATKYYTPKVHRNAFDLPPYAQAHMEALAR
jgi:spermidine synthase